MQWFLAHQPELLLLARTWSGKRSLDLRQLDGRTPLLRSFEVHVGALDTAKRSHIVMIQVENAAFASVWTVSAHSIVKAMIVDLLGNGGKRRNAAPLVQMDRVLQPSSVQLLKHLKGGLLVEVSN